MNVLVACEFSGIVRDAFIRHGHNAISCDLLPSESPGPHIIGDVRELNLESFDLLIAHPPCTYLSNSGVSWLHKDASRWDKMKSGAEFFKSLMDAPINRIAVENPIMHKYSVQIVGRKADQYVQPWMFGHREVKATGLWLKNLPLLKPTETVSLYGLLDSERQRLHYLPPGPDRWKERSRTYTGIADAMAMQWGSIASDGNKVHR